jgi:hypothetical protein
VLVQDGPWGKGYSDSARIRYVVGNEKNRKHILGGGDKGVFATRDKGKTWACDKDFPNQGVQKIRFDPSRKNRLIVTTFGSGVWIGKKH